jgi:hypothetical protein
MQQQHADLMRSILYHLQNHDCFTLHNHPGMTTSMTTQRTFAHHWPGLSCCYSSRSSTELLRRKLTPDFRSVLQLVSELLCSSVSIVLGNMRDLGVRQLSCACVLPVSNTSCQCGAFRHCIISRCGATRSHLIYGNSSCS